MLKIILLGILSLVLVSVSFSQESASDTSGLTPKQKALQLLSDLDNLNDQQLQNSEDLQTQLDNSSQQVVQLKTTLNEVVSSSTDLERSLLFSQTLNNIAIPTGGVLLVTVAIETLYIVFHK